MKVTDCEPETPVSSVAFLSASTLFSARVPVFCVTSAVPLKLFAAPKVEVPVAAWVTLPLPLITPLQVNVPPFNVRVFALRLIVAAVLKVRLPETPP